MTEITFEYWNKLSEQIVMISSLLGGFSIAVIANFLVSNLNTNGTHWVPKWYLLGTNRKCIRGYTLSPVTSL